MSILPTPALIQARSKFKARDIKEIILERGFEKGVVYALQQIADELVGIRQAQNEGAQVQSQLIDLVSQVTAVNGAVAHKVHEMSTRDEKYNESVQVRSERGDS